MIQLFNGKYNTNRVIKNLNPVCKDQEKSKNGFLYRNSFKTKIQKEGEQYG